MLKPVFYYLFLQLFLPDQTTSIKVNQLQNLETRQIVLLDTRSYQEYKVSHLQDARWVGYDDFTVSKVADLPKDTTIVT